jgi:hypothetical protein
VAFNPLDSVKDIAKMILVSVSALCDEAPSLIASHPKGMVPTHLRRKQTRGFCVSGDRNPHVSNVPEWAARKKTPASHHPIARRLNFDQVSMKSHRQVVRQLCDESEWSAYSRASLLQRHEARWAGLITLGRGIV